MVNQEAMMNSTPDTRYSLIGKLRDSQDAEAWAEFAAIYQPLILRIARARGLQHADATDVTQEVLTRVAGAVERFDQDKPGATFRGWLYRITRNVVIDFLRHRDRHSMVQGQTEVHCAIDQEPTQEESAEFQREFQRQIFWLAARQVRTQVQPTTWQAFWQTEVEGQAVAAVAESLGISSGAVYVARSRVLARLRSESEQRLAETHDESP